MSFFRSIWNDLMYTLRVSPIVTRLIVINFGVFLVANILYGLMLLFGQGEAFNSGLYWFCVPASPLRLLIQPWSPFSYMFLHLSFWHLVGNLVFLHMFGTIISDLIGPRRVLPVYLWGGLAGALAFVLSAQFIPWVGSYALGASGAVMALGGAALYTAPEYRVRLLLLGDVKVKYIVLVLLVFDLVGIAGRYNSGGHMAHLGGFALGLLFVRAMKQGQDWSEPVHRILDYLSGQLLSLGRQRRSRTSSARPTPKRSKTEGSLSPQERLDAILDKIKESGLESLTPEEKEFLYNASKK